jgi:hypothetical protein
LRFAKAIIIMLLVSFSTPSIASLIYSTPNPTIGESDGALALGSWQWLASEFSLNQSYSIAQVDGWIMEWPKYGAPEINATVNAVIYSDGGNVPGSKLFSTTFTPGDELNWYGSSGLNWQLDKGTYWMAFEVDRNLAGPSGGPYAYEYLMPSIANSLVHFAAWNKGHPSLNYSSNGYQYIGIRIYGQEVPVAPEPISSILFIAGGATLGFRQWRKKTYRVI